MRRIRVGVKFCGHCNPHIEGEALLESAAASDGQIDFVSWSDPAKSALLVISCCPSDCVEQPEYGGVVVHVAGNSLDGKPLPANEKGAAVVSTIRSRLRSAGFKEAEGDSGR